MPSALPRLAPFFAALVALACAQGPEQAVAPSQSVVNLDPQGTSGRDRYIILLQREVKDVRGTVDRLVRVHGIGQVQYRYDALKGFTATLSGRALDGLMRSPEVRLIEQDQLVSIAGSQVPAIWGLDRIDQRDLPLNGLYGYARTGQRVTVYVVDTGILPTHTEFGGRASVGYDAFSDGQKGIDCNGHGTHVAGTVGGATYGVAKAVTLIGVRVLSCNGSGTISSVLAGLDWVVGRQTSLATPTPAVMNLSLGGYLAETTLDDAVEYSVARGITVVAAAGNGSTSACSFTPGRTPGALTIGATAADDLRAEYSNFGTCLDLFAPGEGILSAGIESRTDTDLKSGTSMAAPHVAGAAALILEANPSATPAQVAAELTATATTGKVTDPGAESPNLLLFTATGLMPAAPAAPASFTASPASTSSIQLTWATVSDADGYQLERIDPLGSSAVVTLATATTSLLVSGLASGATYTFRLRAYNAGGFSAASTAAAATQSSGLTNVRVGGLTAMTLLQKSNWRATVTILVTMESGNAPVAGATVSGRFGTSKAQTCTTASNGTCQITSSGFSRKVASTVFTVTDIKGSNLRYVSGSNLISSLLILQP